MKVALIQCPSWSEIAPPYSPALLAACLMQKGHEVDCFDLNIKFYNYLRTAEIEASWGTSGESNAWLEKDYVINLLERHNSYVDYLVSQILDRDAQIIGFTVCDTSRVFSEEVARKIKEKNRNKIIVFGGPSCFRNSIYNVDFLKRSYIDAICLHEGEISFLDFIEKFEKNGEFPFCPGFAFKDKFGKVINCGERELIEDLDTLPFADFSVYELKEYEKNTLPISTSRGCIYRCVFCNESPIWKKYRHRSAQNIYNEITYQLAKHPRINNFFFNDSLINGDIHMLNELSDLLIKNKVKIRWGGQASIRKEMSFEFLKKLRKAGFSYVSYGLENGSQAILERMQKRFYLDTAQEVIRNTHRLGIRVTANIVVGFPDETEKEMLETANFLKSNISHIDDIYFHSLVLMPGSYLYNHRDNFGIELPEINRLNLWYTRDEKNNYQIRLERIEFFKSILKQKFTSNISRFNYYLTLGDCSYGGKKFEEALGFYYIAKESTQNTNEKKLVENRLEKVKNAM